MIDEFTKKRLKKQNEDFLKAKQIPEIFLRGSSAWIEYKKTMDKQVKYILYLESEVKKLKNEIQKIKEKNEQNKNRLG